MSIEERFDIPFIARLALKEKQIQQNYRPIIAVHKWFARRPGTLFRGLLLSEFADRPLSDAFFRANDFPGRRIADPFMGGGTPLIEANRIGCDVVGADINPMAAWIVREEIEHLNLGDYREAAEALIAGLGHEVGESYLTDCPLYGDRDVPVKYFLWVKTLDCGICRQRFDLFPGYLLAADARHSSNVLVCARCGDLNETASLTRLSKCVTCQTPLRKDGPAGRGSCQCPHCHHVNRYPRPESGPPGHRMFAIEYHNPHRRSKHKGRFFKTPDVRDLQRYSVAAGLWKRMTPDFAPDQPIPSGDETDRLHRWGYRNFRDLFNDRQLRGLELSCRLIASVGDQRVRHALATNLSDLLRYQNMLCRYDTTALKSLDVFSVHGFPVGLVQCESNLLGIVNGKGANVGSGGWRNIVEKYFKAKQYCDAPFEVWHEGKRKVTVPIVGEWIGERRGEARPRGIELHCASSTTMKLPPQSLDAVFTDPPYLGNVQYGELMDFCYAWLRRLVGSEAEGFDRESALSPSELTGNSTQRRGIEQFAEGLSAVYSSMARALKPGAPLAFTFHHNRLEAYLAVAVALLDAGFLCAAALPCPGEMGGSIHIHGKASSIIDTVFVCRSRLNGPPGLDFNNLLELGVIVRDELVQLLEAGLKSRAGDVRCIVYGHLTRMAVRRLGGAWDRSVQTYEKLSRVQELILSFGDIEKAIDRIAAAPPNRPQVPRNMNLFPEDSQDALSLRSSV